MLKIFYGDDRGKIQSAIDKLLGSDYEVIEAESLRSEDMDSIFMGASLFGESRKIVIKDLSINSDCFARLPDYFDTPHQVVIWELNLDKRTATYKALAKKKIIVQEFKTPESVDSRLVFEVFEKAWRGDGRGAVELCDKINSTNDPYMFFGLMVTQALKKMDVATSFARAIKVVKILGEIDIKMKSTAIDAWVLIRLALMGIAGSKE